MLTILIIAMILAGTAYGMSGIAEEHRNAVVENFNLDRYLGRWYEIARFDHRFERGLDYVTAEYVLNDNGTLKVVNRGYDRDRGRLHETVGKAKITDIPGHLRVSFFLFFYSDYDILALGENYDWVLIGSSSPKYLWILSRTPSLSADQLSHILGIARQRGYDISKLIYPAQRPDTLAPRHREAALQQ